LLQYNTNRYGSYAKRCSKQQASCWYRLLTADQNIGTASSICFVLRHGCCLVWNIKSTRVLVTFKNKEMEQ